MAKAKSRKKAELDMSAKGRLDRLINKARAHLYKPIQIAEVLFHHRVKNEVDLSNIDSYRRASTRWRDEVTPVLLRKTPSLNSRYEDQLFGPEVLPPASISELAELNVKAPGVVEMYVYARLRQRFAAIASVREVLSAAKSSDFKLTAFLEHFDTKALKRSVDKAYEIICYALFDSITRHLGAKVTLEIDDTSSEILKDFEDFSRIVLGIDSENPKIVQPARLYRVGTTNAADAGLDMWANFGPAIQVKHITISEEQTADIIEGLNADRVVIVCRKAEAETIERVLNQIGLDDQRLDFITEVDLVEWYDLCFSEKYAGTIGDSVLSELRDQFDAEFPLADLTAMQKFFDDRKYDEDLLVGDWAIEPDEA